MPTYPTKEEILRNPITFNKDIIAVMKYFKTFWIILKNEKTNKKKEKILKELLLHLNKLYSGNPLLSIKFVENIDTSYYEPKTHTIVLKNISIITALHEFYHHLGYNELNACRLSVQLFKLTFPKSYEKLIWEGHLLKKPN